MGGSASLSRLMENEDRCAIGSEPNCLPALRERLAEQFLSGTLHDLSHLL